jgi:ribosomal protein L4
LRLGGDLSDGRREAARLFGAVRASRDANKGRRRTRGEDATGGARGKGRGGAGFAGVRTEKRLVLLARCSRALRVEEGGRGKR